MTAFVVDRCDAADIRKIMRAATDPIDMITLSRDGEDYALVRVNTIAQTMQINQQSIRISSTPCNYGGRRWWLHCPHCDRRCAVLYFASRGWACRSCNQLHYRSQQATKTDNWYYWHQAERIAHVVDPSYRIADGFEVYYRSLDDGTADTFPERPAGMHRTTYKRLREKYVVYMDKGAVQFGKAWERIARRVQEPLRQ